MMGHLKKKNIFIMSTIKLEGMKIAYSGAKFDKSCHTW